MTKWDFQNSYLKVERAKQHISDLEICIADFIKTDFHVLRVEKDADTGNNCLKVGITKPIPNKIALIIGDAVHNLRTALDYIAIEIVKSAGIEISDVHFPFHETKENLMVALKKGKINRAAPNVFSLILDRIKPYKAGNYPLWALNQLDRADKHRLLIPTLTITEISDVCIEGDNGLRMNNCKFEVVDNIIVNALKTPTNIYIKSYGQPTCEIIFINGQVFERERVIRTLNILTSIVNQCIGMFETL